MKILCCSISYRTNFVVAKVYFSISQRTKLLPENFTPLQDKYGLYGATHTKNQAFCLNYEQHCAFRHNVIPDSYASDLLLLNKLKHNINHFNAQMLYSYTVTHGLRVVSATRNTRWPLRTYKCYLAVLPTTTAWKQ